MKDSKKLKEKAENIVNDLKKLFPNSRTVLVYKSPFELLVAVILSARNTDKKVNDVTKDLSKLGLFRQKAKFVKKTAEILLEKHNGELPKTMSELISLPGVGRKTANIILGNVYGIVEGIAVDTHVARLSKLFGLTKNSDPSKIEKDLMRLLPKEEWFDFTNRMIDYGRKYCPAHCKHIDCPLRNFIEY